MASVADHYETHLAPVYAWMAGGIDAAVTRGEDEIASVLPNLSPGSFAVDLGAGFGMHTIPMARRGSTVLAVDTSSLLLDQLTQHTAGLKVRAVLDDLLSFPRYLHGPVDAILVMGDTLTHLPDLGEVRQLFALAAGSLTRRAKFVVTFRDYSLPLSGTDRFIAVKSDSNRVLSCFLEYGPEHVDVHDLLYERSADTWQLRTGVYRKLRIAADWVLSELQAAGLKPSMEAGLSGMVRIVATKP